MSWVVAEHAAASAGEMSVSKGQQVELVEPWAARSDWWVVRAVGGGAGAGEAAQGAVPVHVLKPQPHTQPPAPHAHRKTSPSPSPSRRQLAQPDEPLGNDNLTFNTSYTNVSNIIQYRICLKTRSSQT